MSDAKIPKPLRKKSGNRRFWFRLHGFFSLPVWLLFCFVCLTGTIAVLSHEITWLVNPAARAENPQELPRQPLPALVDAVTAKVPGAEVGNVMVLEPYLVTAVMFSTQDIPAGIAYVNPYTAEVQEIVQGITFIGFMRSLHGWLLFPWQHAYSIGYYLVSALSVLVIGALVTGLVVYRKFWRAFTQPRIRWRSDARTLLGDLHRHAGVWSLWFMLVIGLTGLWYLVQAVLWHNGIEYETETPPVAIADVPFAREGRPAPIALAQALEQARLTLPELEPHWISMPEHNRDYYTVYGSGGAFLFDDFSYRVQVNPWTGAVARSSTPDGMGALEILEHLADPLHYGTFGGLLTKTIWFVSGAVLSAMSVTGFFIWSKRTLKEAGHPPSRRRERRRRTRRAVPDTGAGEVSP